MEQGVSNQLIYLSAVILTGILSGFIYDILRAKRKLVKSGRVCINIEDVFFLIICGGVMLFVTYFYNSGEIRISSFFAMIIGTGLYFLILRNRMVNFLVKIILYVKKFIIFVIKIIFIPVRIILRLFRKPVYIFCWVVGGRLRRFKTIIRINYLKIMHRAKILNIFTKKPRKNIDKENN